ncbi:MAG: DUF1330 domain-containing protein [Gemmatimonas sp.]
MRTWSAVTLAMLAGVAIGAAAVEQLHAQATPPAYVISEIELTNADAYAKEYVPLAQKALRDSGQKVLASGGRTASLSGEPPRARVVVSMFDNLDKARAAYTSPEYLAARKVGDQYGRLRIFAVEGVAQ